MALFTFLYFYNCYSILRDLSFLMDLKKCRLRIYEFRALKGHTHTYIYIYYLSLILNHLLGRS
jgi:hypothetical protein